MAKKPPQPPKDPKPPKKTEIAAQPRRGAIRPRVRSAILPLLILFAALPGLITGRIRTQDPRAYRPSGTLSSPHFRGAFRRGLRRCI